MGAPGFPSEASKKMQDKEINRFFFSNPDVGLRTLFFAITKQCTMKCKHCFEWENLNKEDVLSTSDIINIVRKYQKYGATQIMFSGGEPLLRVNDIYKVLAEVKKNTDFWIITSGLGLDLDQTHKLKQLGLTGVMVSLDHYDEEENNQFRGHHNAYEIAVQAVKNANEVKLVTCLAICTTKEFVSYTNLNNYMKLAKKIGVSFVQLIEPRSKGRYKDNKVELGKKEIEILEETYLKYNSSKDFKDFPIINYLGYHQRRLGCFGGGDRFFYIDTDGDAHLCPYCEGKIANALKLPAKELINKLSEKSCHMFKQYN